MCKGWAKSQAGKTSTISRGSKGGGSGPAEVWVLFMFRPAAPTSQGTGRIPLSHGQGFPTEPVATNSPTNPGTRGGQSSLSSGDLKLSEGEPLSQSHRAGQRQGPGPQFLNSLSLRKYAT